MTNTSQGEEKMSAIEELSLYRDSYIHDPVWRISTRHAERLDALEAEIERLRMQLVACGVVALANTPETAAKAREMHSDYKSASCNEVARAVDREMALRVELAFEKEAHEGFKKNISAAYKVAQDKRSEAEAELAQAERQHEQDFVTISDQARKLAACHNAALEESAKEIEANAEPVNNGGDYARIVRSLKRGDNG